MVMLLMKLFDYFFFHKKNPSVFLKGQRHEKIIFLNFTDGYVKNKSKIAICF